MSNGSSEAAERVRTAANQWAHFHNADADADDVARWATDANDLRAVAAAIQAGSIFHATTLMNDLDTIIRDQIPTPVVEWMRRHV